MNYYDILGVDRTASEEEIKAAYRAMMKAFHPDYYHGHRAFAERKTSELNEAYATLKDPELRKAYDREIFGWNYERDQGRTVSGESEEKATNHNKQAESDPSSAGKTAEESAKADDSGSAKTNSFWKDDGTKYENEHAQPKQKRRRTSQRMDWRGFVIAIAIGAAIIALTNSVGKGQTAASQSQTAASYSVSSTSSSAYSGRTVRIAESSYIKFSCPDEWTALETDDGTTFYGMSEWDGSRFAVDMYYFVENSNGEYEDLSPWSPIMSDLYDDYSGDGSEVINTGTLTDADGEEVGDLLFKNGDTIGEVCVVNSNTEGKAVYLTFIYSDYSNTEQQDLVRAVVKSFDCEPLK